MENIWKVLLIRIQDFNSKDEWHWDRFCYQEYLDLLSKESWLRDKTLNWHESISHLLFSCSTASYFLSLYYNTFSCRSYLDQSFPFRAKNPNFLCEVSLPLEANSLFFLLDPASCPRTSCQYFKLTCFITRWVCSFCNKCSGNSAGKADPTRWLAHWFHSRQPSHSKSLNHFHLFVKSFTFITTS